MQRGGIIERLRPIYICTTTYTMTRSRQVDVDYTVQVGVPGTLTQVNAAPLRPGA